MAIGDKDMPGIAEQVSDGYQPMPVVPPGYRDEDFLPPRHEFGSDETPTLELIFTDAAGRRWRREGATLEPWPLKRLAP